MNACIPLLLLLMGANPPAAERPAVEPGMCQLFVDGQGIEALELKDEEDVRRGTTQRVTIAGPSLSLKPGLYRVRGVFKGGYSANAWTAISLTPEKPYHLQSGGPLRPRVEVKRQGRLLKMDYQLLDAIGRNCAGDSRDSSRRPGFVIRQDGREIASGDFEYG